MADPEDRMQPDGAPPDGRPRRPPPIIEGEAVEIPADGSPVSSAGIGGLLRRVLGFLASRKAMVAAAASLLVAFAGTASWMYLNSERGGGVPPQGGTGVERAASAEAAAAMPPAPADARTAGAEEREKQIEDRLQDRLTAVDATLATLNDRVVTLDRMVRDTAAAARAAAERADRTARLLEEAKKNGDEQEAAQQIDRGALDDLATRIKTLESRQMTVRQIQDRLDRLAGAAGSPDKAVRAAVAAAALRNAVERDGRPFAAELAAARTLGLDEGALAALEPFAAAGMPKRNDLFRDLSALLPELRQASASPSQDLGYLDRIQASAVRMLHIRPVKDEPGDDPAAVLSRIEFKMVQLDIDGIVAELDKLPAKAKDAAQPWRMRALARRDAAEAARHLAIASLAKLGDPATSGSSGSSPQ